MRWSALGFAGSCAHHLRKSGQTATYARLPYFTDKHNLGMEYTGYTAPQADHDLVIRGDLATREFIALWLVNIWEMNEQIRN